MSAAFGETRVFTQENGPDVSLRVFGDEFYARYETTDGYTCLWDAELGLYCYAILNRGSFVSTGVPIAVLPPAGVQSHLKENPDVRNAKFDAQFDSLRPPPSEDGGTILETYGPNEGLLEGHQLNRGHVCGLAILVDFQDIQTTITVDEVSELLNADNYTENGNYCSVREYFRLMSSGALDYCNVVIGPLRLSHERHYYVDNLLAAEALDLAKESGLDFLQFDSRGIGAIDAVSFLYAGDTIWEGSLWPHNSIVRWRSGGYRAGIYQITGLGLHSSDLTIGTFCHESGHLLCRFPDLYDYGRRDGDFERSAGLGVYCLMSAGNHLDGGRTPAPICAYLRYLADWCPNQISLKTPGAYEAAHGAYDTVLVYETSRQTEFFLLENRGRFGLDQHLPSSGLAVYHCDTEGSNERQRGTAEQHYQCSLLQADGRLDLEQNANRGDADDFFALLQGEALSGSTYPSTKMWDGSDSGLRIADISATDKTIMFLVLLRRNSMNGISSSTEVDPLVLEHLQQQKEILEANLDLLKLTQEVEQQKLAAEVDKVKLEAERQQAEMDKLKALFPSGTTKSLSGETKTDEKFGYLAKLAVQGAIRNAAQEIAKRVRNGLPSTKPARIVLVDTLDFCGDDIHAIQISRQMETLKEDLDRQITVVDDLLKSGKLEEQIGEEVAIAGAALLPVISQVLAAAPGMVSWAADIAAYFQIEDTYKSVDVTVPLTALQACVAGALVGAPPDDRQEPEEPSATVCFPRFHTFADLTDLPILTKFNECTAAREELSTKAAQLKVLVDSAKTKEADLAPETLAHLKLTEAAYTTSQSLMKTLGDFSKQITAVPEGNSYSPLALVAIREHLKTNDGKELTHLLYMNVDSSGGEVSIRKTLWWSRDVVFLGGCIVTFILADVAGKTLAAGTLGKLTQTKYARGQIQPVQFEDLA